MRASITALERPKNLGKFGSFPFTVLAFAAGYGITWLLPTAPAVVVGVALICVGLFAPRLFSSSPWSPRVSEVKLTGIYVLVLEFSLPVVLWAASGVCVLAGVVFLIRLPALLRRSPEFVDVRRELTLTGLLIALLPIPLLSGAWLFDTQRPFVTCIAMLPTALWAMAIFVLMLRTFRRRGATLTGTEQQQNVALEQIQFDFASFMSAIPFFVAAFVTFMAVVKIEPLSNGWVLAAPVAFIGTVLIRVMDFRHRPDWMRWAMLGMLNGSLPLCLSAFSWRMTVVGSALFGIWLTADMLLVFIGRWPRWTLSPVRSFQSMLMPSTVSIASVAVAINVFF